MRNLALATLPSALLFATFAARADDALPSWPFSLHFQETTVTQGHPSLRSKYAGANSLDRGAETETSVTSTLFAGAALWSGAEFYVNPELSGGGGVSAGRGVAGFPNGEAFRIGDPTPVISPARLFLRQTIDFGEATEEVPEGANAIAGRRAPHRLTITAGKFGIADIFDNNRYTHDPRTQFMSWALMNSGAWDYPADTRGYTWGLSLDYAHDEWAVRAASMLVPLSANGLTMDTHIDKALGFAVEGELHHHGLGREGALRLLLFLNDARMGDYERAIAASATLPDVTLTRQYGRTKYGFALGFEQELTENLGAFARLSWNDGQHETWAFAEIDHSLAAGAVASGLLAAPDVDQLGAALVVQGISGPHRRYLAAGGYGFMIGDGALAYGLETIGELYYKLVLLEHFSFTADYQFVANPAYNRDRGPVHVFGLRAHIEI